MSRLSSPSLSLRTATTSVEGVPSNLNNLAATQSSTPCFRIGIDRLQHREHILSVDLEGFHSLGDGFSDVFAERPDLTHSFHGENEDFDLDGEGCCFWVDEKQNDGEEEGERRVENELDRTKTTNSLCFPDVEAT